MADNIITSDNFNKKPVEKSEKKEVTKKTTKKTVAAPKNTNVKIGNKLIVFESGASYTSGEVRFTSDNRIQEVPEADAELLLKLDNFRLPTQFEVDDYFMSKED